MIYGARSNGNLHGQVITKPIVVDTMLDRVGYIASKDLSSVKIVEPAAGDGAFALTIINRLYKSSKKFNFSFEKALQNISLYEIDEVMSNSLRNRIKVRLNELSANIPESLIVTDDFLLFEIQMCDIVIGNPPYVRHENIPDDKKSTYRKKFGTFTHRSDLFIAFYEKGLKILNPEGVLSFICSNRWLKNQYGQRLRELIGLQYSINEIIDLEGTCPFEEEVIAYPAITTIRNTTKKIDSKYYKINDINDLIQFPKAYFSSRTLNTRTSKDWFSYNEKGHRHEKYLDTIVNQGFKIGIGVATGLDKVFIRNDFQQLIENELLLPILISKDLKGNELKWSGNYVLNPYQENGDLIDLEKYPKAKNYLITHQDALQKRHVSKKYPEKWYKTIDRINPELTYKDKIILPDMSGNYHIFIDRGQYYPHHNLYYVTGKSYENLVLLSAVLMSDFVMSQLLELGNKMNGGYPRWQSQNIKKLKVPIISAIPKDSARRLADAYNHKDISEINKLVIPLKISEYSFSIGD
jgi:hypothetical protein